MIDLDMSGVKDAATRAAREAAIAEIEKAGVEFDHAHMELHVSVDVTLDYFKEPRRRL